MSATQAASSAAPGSPTSPASPTQTAPRLTGAREKDVRERVKETDRAVRSETPSPVTDDEGFMDWTPALFQSGITVSRMKRHRYEAKAENLKERESRMKRTRSRLHREGVIDAVTSSASLVNQNRVKQAAKGVKAPPPQPDPASVPIPRSQSRPAAAKGQDPAPPPANMRGNAGSRGQTQPARKAPPPGHELILPGGQASQTQTRVSVSPTPSPTSLPQDAPGQGSSGAAAAADVQVPVHVAPPPPPSRPTGVQGSCLVRCVIPRQGKTDMIVEVPVMNIGIFDDDHGIKLGQDMSHTRGDPGSFENDRLLPVAQPHGHVFLQRDFVGVTNAYEAVVEGCVMHQILPVSMAYESWICHQFRDEEMVRQCSVSITGLPKYGGDWPYGKVKHWVMTVKGLLPKGHRGLLAFKARWEDRDQDGNQAFSGHIWLLWSNSVLARTCVMKLRGCELVNHKHLPVRIDISDKAFRFTSSKDHVDAPKYGHEMWRGM